MARKPLTEIPGEQVILIHFKLTVGEKNAIKSYAEELNISQADLMRGSLNGLYSIGDLLKMSKEGVDKIVNLSITSKMKDRIDTLVSSSEKYLSFNNAIKHLLYES